MVCGLDFDYPNWFYKTTIGIAIAGILMFVVSIFIFSSAEVGTTAYDVTRWLLVAGAILIVPAIVVFFTRSSEY